VTATTLFNGRRQTGRRKRVDSRQSSSIRLAPQFHYEKRLFCVLDLFEGAEPSLSSFATSLSSRTEKVG
jgi:hypothetical protein